MNVAMWPTGRDVLQSLNPCGQPGANPNKENAGRLTLQFDEMKVVYPVHSTIVASAVAGNREELDRTIRDSPAEREVRKNERTKEQKSKRAKERKSERAKEQNFEF